MRGSIGAFRAAGAAAALLVAGSGVALAQGGGAAGAAAEPNVPAVSLRQTAAALARAGIAHHDARSVLAAAQLLIVADRPARGLDRVGSAPAPAARGDEQAKLGPLSAAGLLREATHIAVEQHDAATANAAAELAGNTVAGLGDAALATQLKTQATSIGAGARGAVGGPVWADGVLGLGDVVEYHINFEGGYTPNRITVSAGNNAADLDCYLYDGSQLAASDNSYARDCSIGWSQRWTGVLTLRVSNAGASTYFVMVSN